MRGRTRTRRRSGRWRRWWTRRASGSTRCTCSSGRWADGQSAVKSSVKARSARGQKAADSARAGANRGPPVRAARASPARLHPEPSPTHKKHKIPAPGLPTQTPCQHETPARASSWTSATAAGTAGGSPPRTSGPRCWRRGGRATSTPASSVGAGGGRGGWTGMSKGARRVQGLAPGGRGRPGAAVAARPTRPPRRAARAPTPPRCPPRAPRPAPAGVKQAAADAALAAAEWVAALLSASDYEELSDS
jgi:hypothetical protein